MQNFDIAIANDHTSVNLKIEIVNFLRDQKFNVLDLGTDDEVTVDYPDYVDKVREEIISETIDKAILICSTGIGMSIAANRSSMIRAALCTNIFMAQRARSHNNANILVLGSKVTSNIETLKIVDKFLNTKFEGGRHARRLDKLK
jgi:ribose 5-phosphate isomerase B